MNSYQSVSLKKIFENILKKSGFGVITLQYLPFLAKAMSPLFKKSRLHMPQIY